MGMPPKNYIGTGIDKGATDADLIGRGAGNILIPPMQGYDDKILIRFYFLDLFKDCFFRLDFVIATIDDVVLYK